MTSSGGLRRSRQLEEAAEDNNKKKKKKVGDGDLSNGKPQPQQEAAIESRLEMLNEISRVLKSIDSFLRSCNPAKLPTMDEQRLLNLILSHVDSCILLYYTTTPSSSSSSSSSPVIDSETTTKRRRRRRRLPSALDFEARIINLGSRITDCIIEPLEEYRCAVTGFNREEARPKAKDIALHFRNRRPLLPPLDVTQKDSGAHSFLSFLVDFMHTLTVLAQRRGYAPPRDEGDEIGCYKEIRRQVCSTLIYIRARAGGDPLLIATPEIHIFPGSYPHFRTAGDDLAPTFFPFGQMFARSFDVMQLCRRLSGQCRGRLSEFLSCSGDWADAPRRDCDPIVTSSRLIRWDAEEEEEEANADAGGIMRTRIECLNIILAKVEKIASFTTWESKLTDRELCLYAHIAEHVRTSRYLSVSSASKDRQETCMVNVAGIKEVAPTAQGDGLFTREQYLEDIMSYLRLFKPLFSAEALTMGEMEAYRNIWMKLGSHFLWCSFVKPMQVNKKKPPASLDEGLFAVRERGLECLEEAEKEESDIIALVLGAIMPEEAAKAQATSSMDAFKWSKPSNETLRKFLGDDSAEGIKMLDCLLVMLRELIASNADISCKLNAAMGDAVQELRDGKNFAMLEREVMNASCMMSCKS